MSGSNIGYINFNQDNFELSQDRYVDVYVNYDYWIGLNIVEGKYTSDTSYIYLFGRGKDKNKETNEYMIFEEKVRYEFKVDSLIIGMVDGLKEMNENYPIAPHVFIKNK